MPCVRIPSLWRRVGYPLFRMRSYRSARTQSGPGCRAHININGKTTSNPINLPSIVYKSSGILSLASPSARTQSRTAKFAKDHFHGQQYLNACSKRTSFGATFPLLFIETTQIMRKIHDRVKKVF